MRRGQVGGLRWGDPEGGLGGRGDGEGVGIRIGGVGGGGDGMGLRGMAEREGREGREIEGIGREMIEDRRGDRDRIEIVEGDGRLSQ